MGFTAEDRHLIKCWNPSVGQCVNWLRHAIFHYELFAWFIFLAECEILNFVDVSKHTRTASLRGWPLAKKIS